MKRIKRGPLRRAGKSGTDPRRQRIGASPPETSGDEIPVEGMRGAGIEDVFPGGCAELQTQPDAQQTPEWVLRMRERGIAVREPLPGAVIEPFKAVRQAGPLLAFWRRAVRRLRDSRAVS
jgi:hypothetical protein